MFAEVFQNLKPAARVHRLTVVDVFGLGVRK